MKSPEIKSGDRVLVTRFVNGYNRGTYKATVLGWSGSGLLKIQPDDKAMGVKNISADNAKKISQ